MGSLQKLASSKVKTNPAFIMKHPTLDIVYIYIRSTGTHTPPSFSWFQILVETRS